MFEPQWQTNTPTRGSSSLTSRSASSGFECGAGTPLDSDFFRVSRFEFPLTPKPETRNTQPLSSLL